MPAFQDSSAEISSALGVLPRGTPASEVAHRLLDLFTGGSIEPGTRLPPERRLAATLGVGRSAVREALAALEILGIVNVRPGSGTYLGGGPSDLLPQTLRWGLLIGKKSTVELLELRSGLEIYTARLAAGRATSDAVVPAQAALERMRAQLRRLKAFAAADREFHEALALIAGNSVLNDQLHVVQSLLQVYASRSVHDEASAHRAVDEHQAILTAVADADADGAASAMAVHMATASARLLAAG
jgi:GntR family transcriptional repressor for pyruvate dehydrogenase complex